MIWVWGKPFKPGLSPRVRGNHSPFCNFDCGNWSIPAGAGEPQPPVNRRLGCKVYPRGCGGTQAQGHFGCMPKGLSPRVRGNQPYIYGDGNPERSIPAGAGEPCRYSWKMLKFKVYPRGCGGTFWVRVPVGALKGLSPRVRGNPWTLILGRWKKRSIPAGAGEPTVNLFPRHKPEVYPRGCGGTD